MHRCSAASWDWIRSTHWKSPWPYPSATASSCVRTIRTIGRSSPACARCPRTSSRTAPVEAGGSVRRRPARFLHAAFHRPWQARTTCGADAEPGMTSSSLLPQPAARRYGLLLLPADPLLAIAGAVTQRQVFALLALALLLTALLLPQLLARRT